MMSKSQRLRPDELQPHAIGGLRATPASTYTMSGILLTNILPIFDEVLEFKTNWPIGRRGQALPGIVTWPLEK
jgi:hypothetical protein